MHLLVVGAGEMGRWFARYSGADAVAFADRDPEVARDAADRLRDGDGRETAAVPLDTDDRFDVVCVAVPMRATPAAIADHAERATAAVVDVSGEMRDAVAALREHAADRERASFHPLFSASNAPGNVPVVVDEPGPTVDAVRESLSDAGNRVFETTVEEHDAAMETVQATVHAAVVAYAQAADPVDERFQTALSGPFEDLVGEVLDGDPDVYADIQDRFDGAGALAEAAASVASADRETFRELFEGARR